MFEGRGVLTSAWDPDDDATLVPDAPRGVVDRPSASCAGGPTLSPESARTRGTVGGHQALICPR